AAAGCVPARPAAGRLQPGPAFRAAVHAGDRAGGREPLDALDAGADRGRLAGAEVDPPPLNGSTLKYGFDHEGGPQWQTSDTSPTRSSRSFGRLRFCAAKAWRWRMLFA